ncbi:MAG: hypothetical protein ACOYM2_21685, partial [Rectinemataceae bacterium]
MSDDSRLYSDREVALIVKTALDIERKGKTRAVDGLLLSEIEEIARETGISVEHIRIAVAGIAERGKQSGTRLLLGSDVSFERIDILPQALNQDELERLNKSLPTLTVLSESSVVDSGTISWRRGILKSLLDGFPLSLSVRQGKRGTEIEASCSLKSMALALFAVSSGLGVIVGLKVAVFAMLIIGIGNLSIPMSVLFLALGGLVGLGGFWFLARVAFRAFVKRSRAKVATIVDKIKTAIR